MNDLFAPAYSLATVIAALIVGLIAGRITAGARDPRRAEEKRRQVQLDAISTHERLVRLPEDVRANAARLLAEDRKIEAIRDIRAATGLGLKEAKDITVLLERESRESGGARAP